KREGLYDYINIGVYPDEMKARIIEHTERVLSRGHGFMLGATWLQCPPPGGPHHTPGGSGTEGEPGIRWWLEHLRTVVGPYDHDGG
ncbi:MAG: hypothetical protein PVH68_16325, partial [Armatimonadota bacterium]